MNHKVNSVTDLYNSSLNLYNNYVIGTNELSATTIMNYLREGIEILKNTWQGIDAGIQINNVVSVYNAIVKVKNLLASLCVDTSKIASDYRAIQRENGATLEELNKIPDTALDSLMSDYYDVRDTINITLDAVNGKEKIDLANNVINEFINEVKKSINEIMDNWTVGPKRDEINQSFAEFLYNSDNYIKMLNDASQSIKKALQNYGI